MIDVVPFKHILFTFSMTMARMLAVFAVVPFLGSQIIQGLVRNSIILSIALILYPMVAPTVPADMPPVPLLALILIKEVAIGLIIGFLVSIVFWVAESIGFFIDNQRGTTMASAVDPMSGSQTSPLGSIFLQMTAVLFFTSGGFLALLSGLFESYRFWPIFSFFPHFDESFAMFFLRQADTLMGLTVLLAAPVIIAVFVAEFGLGLINRFAPQLNVFFLSMPIKSGIASFLLVLYVPLLLYFFRKQFAGVGMLFQFLKNIMGNP
jgi:type III secretion protein T